MTALMINGLSILMLLFFGAMALFPLLLPDRAGKQPQQVDEDLVLHISPAPMIERATPAANTYQPVAIGGLIASTTPPSRREAA
jgi:hypothetical protein